MDGNLVGSPTADGQSVIGIGRDEVGEIWYRALTVYMTSSTKYAGERELSRFQRAVTGGASGFRRAVFAFPPAARHSCALGSPSLMCP